MPSGRLTSKPAEPPEWARRREFPKQEAVFLAEADKRGLSPRDLDSQIWDAAAGLLDEEKQDA